MERQPIFLPCKLGVSEEGRAMRGAVQLGAFVFLVIGAAFVWNALKLSNRPFTNWSELQDAQDATNQQLAELQIEADNAGEAAPQPLSMNDRLVLNSAKSSAAATDLAIRSLYLTGLVLLTSALLSLLALGLAAAAIFIVRDDESKKNERIRATKAPAIVNQPGDTTGVDKPLPHGGVHSLAFFVAMIVLTTLAERVNRSAAAGPH